MTRLELYHHQTRHFNWKGPLFILVFSLFILAGCLLGYRHYFENSIKLDAPKPNLGPKVVVQLPNGQKVFTYKNLIYQKDGKTFYQGERNMIDLTGGTVAYQNWNQ